MGRPSDDLFIYGRMNGTYQLPSDSIRFSVEKLVVYEYWVELPDPPRITEYPGGTISGALVIEPSELHLWIGNGLEDPPTFVLSLLSRDPSRLDLCGPPP